MTRKPGRPPAQSDLLGAPPGHETVAADHKTKVRRTARAARPRSEGVKKPDPPLQADLFTSPLPPRPRPPRTRFDVEELRLSVVPASGFSAQAAPDSWLYLVTDTEDASHLLANGLPLRKIHPPLLTERGGVAHWLMKMTEDPPGLFATTPVVLRLRRAMVAGWLEPDPDHSAEFSAPCYLLSGSRQEQD
ncbi:hypothetical protein [Acetobacter persici]|uniref:hypothetical protein n=1 Tax=Acetobacter persici TaxID=1076596 RepID=UPI0039EB9676